jgi:hypothetical protein
MSSLPHVTRQADKMFVRELQPGELEKFYSLPVRQHRLLPGPQEVHKRNHDREPRQQSSDLKHHGLVQVERGLHKYRAQQNDRGGDAKNF